ncbi:MAG TPA: hypothetical protein VK843_13425 [Planctomycetota bacterium]|nr:hypothetical protein [Planctomycetota bacterium]
MSEHRTIDYVIGGAVVFLVAVYALPWLWNRISQSWYLRRQLAEWKEIAEPLGFRVERGKDMVTIHGLVASRPFELDWRNFITYGLDTQTGMRVKLENNQARLSISTSTEKAIQGTMTTAFYGTFGPVQPPVGDAEFDAVYTVRANEAGRRLFDLLGAAGRRMLLDAPWLEVHWRGNEPWIEVTDWKLDAARLIAVHRLMASLIEASDAEAKA